MPSVTLDEQTARRLDKLRGAVRRRTGRPVSRADIVGRLIDDGYASRDETVDLFRDATLYVADDETGAVQRPQRKLVAGSDDRSDE
ncbi:hypothetical protein [Haloarcula salina]|uniref:Uncharacterized protein n=1 Tax=Haloarcula salina TaxID=1429914 RepID=A0AA41KE27_9EURY|nr:hypothetical protein [Haloarcula salina]MBV0900447.1 hypothetical protein [Haloarcula salina]